MSSYSINRTEAKIITWFKIKDELKTYKSICRKFPDVPKEEMDMYLHHLCEIGVLYGGEQIIGNMYGLVDARINLSGPFDEEFEDLYDDDDEQDVYRDILEDMIEEDIEEGILLTGTQYEGRAERIENVKVGDMVHLVREPNNEYDSNAIHVFNEEGSLGYIPAGIAEGLAPMMDEGRIQTDAVVIEVTPLSVQKKPEYADLVIKVEKTNQE